MTSMMLGTFTNGTGISSSPADYVMAGKKTGTTEAVFNPEYTSDQWVIGYLGCGHQPLARFPNNR